MSAEEPSRIDEWVIDARLGTGGMGSVYRCHNVASDRILAAIKVLDRRSVHEDAAARFLREAEILFSLEHPNIVQVRSIHMEADPPYLEMEFIEGTSLEDWIRHGPMEPERATAIIRQALDALVYMHERGVCHRDLKPANLLLTDEDQLKIVDFGLAVQPEYGRLTTEGFTFGTVSYAPPEWGQPDGLDPVQWDLYAVGVVFYELLRGAYAFPLSGEGTIKQQLMQVMLVKQQAPALDVGREFPIEARQLIAALTDPDPAHRPTTARQARDWFVQGVPPEHRVTQGSPWLRPALGVVFATLGAATAMAAVTAVWPYLQDPPPSPPAPYDALVSELDAIEVPEALPVSLVPRSVTVRADGLPTALSFAVATSGGPPVFARRGVASLDEVEPAPTKIDWVAGTDCDPCWTESLVCPTWCARGTEFVGTDDREVIVPFAVQSRRLVVDVPTLAGEVVRNPFRKRRRPRYPLEGRLDRARGDVPNHHSVVFEEVWPGRHTLTIDVGECAPADSGCWPEDCPAGCTSLRESLVVPWVLMTGDGALPDVSVVRELTPPR